MSQNASKSPFLNYVVLMGMHLKWAWNLVLGLSFYHSNINLNVKCYKHIDDIEEEEECAICLCKIDEDDEIRELRCDHLFHKGCLDRWLRCGSLTCPVCRDRLKTPPPFAAELHQQVVYFDFCAATDGGRDRWWIR